jgi:2-oxoglutarate ferredoxin oxidoreductase subunit gamma
MGPATADKLYEGVIIAGFGGQGIILAGRLLAQTAMNAGKEVTYIPAYGAEVRGGTSNCTVVIADEPVACPIIDHPDSLIVMNKASLDKFAPQLKKNGLLIYNSSLINDVSTLEQNIDALAVPADEIAVRLGSQKAANMVMLGASLQARGLFSVEAAAAALAEALAQRYHKTIPLNTNALQAGAKIAAHKC